MARKTSILHIFVDAAIFVGLEIAAAAMLKHSGQTQDAWISKGMDAVNASVWGSIENVKGYFGLRRQNDALALENHHLKQQLIRYGLDTLVTEDPEIVGSFYCIPATIVKHSSNSQHNVLILNKGSMDNVIAGSGVITDKGVIGTIDAVSEHYAHVVSFCNTETVISARIGHEGSVGPLKWDGISNSGAILSEIPYQEGIEPGDTVYTSGFSSLFPADIPLGVTGKSNVVNGATLTIHVKLFEDIRKVRYVVIASNNDGREIQSLIDAENEESDETGDR